MESVLFAVLWRIELEKPELNRAFRKGRVVVEHMVSRTVVMLIPSIVFALALVPNICECRHRLGLLLVDLFQEGGIHRSAIAVDALSVELEGFGKQAFVACHDVR